MIRTLRLLIPLLGCLGAPAPADEAPVHDERVEEIVDRVALETGYPPARLRGWLRSGRIRPEIVEAIETPAEDLPWFRYRRIFLTDERVDQGVEFWQRHQDHLQRAEQQYGVPAPIITAILGVETLYGRRTGDHRVLDALLTLGLAYPPRSEFFLSELEHFLHLAAEEGVDPVSAQGSYAGAMGLPQFIPSSYRAYAVDFDQDGRRDLLDNPADAIGSIAHYLAAHGWQRNARVAVPLTHSGAVPQRYRGNAPDRVFKVSELGWVGLFPDPALDPATQGAVVELEGEDGGEFWLGLQNFRALTRYNHSPLYAMAVFQLSRALQAEMDTDSPNG